MPTLTTHRLLFTRFAAAIPVLCCASACAAERYTSSQKLIVDSINAQDLLPVLDCDNPAKVLTDLVAVAGTHSNWPASKRFDLYRLIAWAATGEMCGPGKQSSIDREDVVAAIIAGASDDSAAIRVLCARSLARVDQARFDQARAPLVTLVRDPDRNVAYTALTSLVGIGVTDAADIALMKSIALWEQPDVLAVAQKAEKEEEIWAPRGPEIAEMRSAAVGATLKVISPADWLDQAPAMDSDGRFAVVIALSCARDAQMVPLADGDADRLEECATQLLADPALRPVLSQRQIHKIVQAAVPTLNTLKQPTSDVRTRRVIDILSSMPQDPLLRDQADSRWGSSMVEVIRSKTQGNSHHE